MVDFDALKNKASELLNEHGDKVDEGADKGAEFVKGKFGHDEQVDSVVEKIKGATPERE